MSELDVIPQSERFVDELHERLNMAPRIFSFLSDIEFASRLASYGICREVGTPNDELARFIFDANTGKLVSRYSLRAEMIVAHGKVGVQIRSNESAKLEVRIRGFRDLVHPKYGENSDGSFS